jgi:hypothetical protein
MILAARYPERVDKLVVWGSLSYIGQQDMKLYKCKPIACLGFHIRGGESAILGCSNTRIMGLNLVCGLVVCSRFSVVSCGGLVSNLMFCIPVTNNPFSL